MVRSVRKFILVGVVGLEFVGVSATDCALIGAGALRFAAGPWAVLCCPCCDSAILAFARRSGAFSAKSNSRFIRCRDKTPSTTQKMKTIERPTAYSRDTFSWYSWSSLE
eukprot:6209366-Pleurochrysis_carterae.AAC.8